MKKFEGRKKQDFTKDFVLCEPCFVDIEGKCENCGKYDTFLNQLLFSSNYKEIE